MAKKTKRAQTLGQLRALLASPEVAGLPDKTPLSPDWYAGPPNDREPGITFHGIAVAKAEFSKREKLIPYLSVLVGLFHLNED